MIPAIQMKMLPLAQLMLLKHAVDAASAKWEREQEEQCRKEALISTVTKNFYDPLQRIRHSYTDYEAGDANPDYRQTQSRIEYTPGSFNQTDTAYGAIIGGKEALVSGGSRRRGRLPSRWLKPHRHFPSTESRTTCSKVCR